MLVSKVLIPNFVAAYPPSVILELEIPSFLKDITLTPTLFLQVTSPLFWVWTKFGPTNDEALQPRTSPPSTPFEVPVEEPQIPSVPDVQINVSESGRPGSLNISYINPYQRNPQQTFLKQWFENSTVVRMVVANSSDTTNTTEISFEEKVTLLKVLKRDQLENGTATGVS